jgi:hypothetical protein
MSMSLSSIWIMCIIYVGWFMVWIDRHVINLVTSQPINHELTHCLVMVCKERCFMTWLRDTFITRRKSSNEESVHDKFDLCGLPISQYVDLNLLGNMSFDGKIFYAVPNKKDLLENKGDDMYQIYLIYLLSNRYYIQVESQSAKTPKCKK